MQRGDLVQEISLNDRRLIEEAFPIREISTQSVREKNVRHGHISTLHIWWARRPLVACRAALLGSLLRDPGDEAGRKNLTDFLVRFCTWEASNDPKLVEEARRLVLASNNGQPPKVLDCFAGGGAIPLEALRIGCEAQALELNPVAVVIEFCSLVYPQIYGMPIDTGANQSNLHGERKGVIENQLAYDVQRWGDWVLKETHEGIGKFYPSDREGAVPAAYVWARTVKCSNPSCNAEVPLLRQLWLARKAKKKIALKLIPDPKNKRVDVRIVDSTGIDFDPEVGTMRQGSAECPCCKTALTREYLKKESTSGEMGERIIAVVLSSPRNRKTFRLANSDDERIFRTAKAALANLVRDSSSRLQLVPNEPISRDWPRTILLPLYGIANWGQMFNPRQALAIVSFVRNLQRAHEAILTQTGNQEYSKAVSTYLALVLDRMIDFSNSCCRWHPQWEFVVNTFARQAIPMTWDYAELVPFSPILSGTWNGMLSQIVETLVAMGKVPAAKAHVRQGTATRLPYGNENFDAVITDPPYYSAVPYADLSDFFYVWLKRTVGFLYPELFSTLLTPKAAEIVEQMPHSSLKNRKDKAFFTQEMTKALQEINRVLKPEGVCTIAFAHKTTTPWQTLIAALITAGFTVSSSWPLHTEMKERMRAQKSAALASSVWLVCRKRHPGAGVGSWKSVQAELDLRVKERLDHFMDRDIKGADALLSAIGPALEVFGKYEKVEKVTGDPVTVNEFLDKVREVVAHHALAAVLSEQELGRLDQATASYVLWKWTFEPSLRKTSLGASEPGSKAPESDPPQTRDRIPNGNDVLVAYDDALKLARSVGAEPDALLGAKGLLEQESANVHLLGPEDRKDMHGLGETARDGTPPATIDMIHRAVNLWSSQDYPKLDEFLKSSGAASNDAFWRVTQALSNLLPMQSHEKQMIDGLMARYGGESQISPHKVKTLDEYAEKDLQ